MDTRSIPFPLLALAWVLPACASADVPVQNPARQALEIKWYAHAEQPMRKAYELQRAKWQAELSSKGAPWTDAHERRLRMIAYNRAAFLAVCTARILETDGPTGVPTHVPTCMKLSVDELDRYFEKAKLINANNKSHYGNCAKSAIDAAREAYLPPYDFLSEPPNGPHLYNFEKLNACLDANH